MQLGSQLPEVSPSPTTLLDAPSVAQQSTTPRKRPIEPKSKNVECDEEQNLGASQDTWDDHWQEYSWDTKEHEAAKRIRAKVRKRSNSKGKSKGKGTPRSKTPRPALAQNGRQERSLPKPKPEARSRTSDGYLFAMMSSKSKPTWRRTSWDSTDYMVCTIAEPPKQLPVFKSDKWIVDHYRKITLYGHDAQKMKQFTLHSRV